MHSLRISGHFNFSVLKEIEISILLGTSTSCPLFTTKGKKKKGRGSMEEGKGRERRGRREWRWGGVIFNFKKIL